MGVRGRMRIEWLVAKYMPDPVRREPRNIGVILRSGDELKSRFLGQKEDGSIEGRTVRARVGASADYFKAWVSHWVTHAEGWNGGELDGFLAGRSADSYFLEYGGERLVGAESTDPAVLLDDLYYRLVEDRPAASIEVPTASELADRVLRHLGIDKKVDRGVIYPMFEDERLVDRVRFDYKYENGAVNLMQRLALGASEVGSDPWVSVHNAVWSFSRIDRYPVVANPRRIALVRVLDHDEDVAGQVDLLSQQAVVVNVAKEDQASAELERVFGSKVVTPFVMI